ncbi:MAG: FhaA domain-containing protein, partial [Acidimicrobiales bacterium]
LVEGAFARAFRGGLQPVEIGRRLTREMDLHRSVGVNGIIAPNIFGVMLSEEDLDRFDSFSDALVRELAEAAREHARTEKYGFVGPVEVELRSDPSLSPGTLELDVQTRAGPDGTPASLMLADGQRVELRQGTLTIGRMPDCGIVLADPNVSRHHAELRRQGSDSILVDLGSTNGTKVNGAAIDQRRLVDGDQITIGTTSLRFEAS